MSIHIHQPKGRYLGQIRKKGYRSWRTVVRTRISAQRALSVAVTKMEDSDVQARVIFCTDDGWYEPNLLMEATRK